MRKIFLLRYKESDSYYLTDSVPTDITNFYNVTEEEYQTLVKYLPDNIKIIEILEEECFKLNLENCLKKDREDKLKFYRKLEKEKRN